MVIEPSTMPTSEQAPGIGLGGQVAGQRSEEQRSDAAGGQCEAGVVGGIAHQSLQIERQQDQAGIKDEAEHADEKDSGAERAILEHAQIDDGMVGHQLANDQGDQAEHAEGREDANVVETRTSLCAARYRAELATSRCRGPENRFPKDRLCPWLRLT